jgi:hypothetical protein
MRISGAALSFASPQGLWGLVYREAEARAGVSHGKVVHPTAQRRVDQLHDPIDRLGSVAAEHERNTSLSLRENTLQSFRPLSWINAHSVPIWMVALSERKLLTASSMMRGL